MSADSRRSATTTQALLYLYECLTEPEHVEHMIEMTGDWLSEDDNVLTIAQLETHSQKILGLLEEVIHARQTVHQRHVVPHHILNVPRDKTSVLEKLEQELSLQFASDWITKFNNFLTGDNNHLLAKVFLDENETPDLCLFKKQRDAHGLRLEIWHDNLVIDDFAEDLLKDHLSISHSEFLVIQEIAVGVRTSKIAANLGKSEETIRSQIKSISNKMGVSGQIEIAANLRKLESFSSAIPQDSSQRENRDDRVLVLADGRKLSYSIYGPTNGKPILFFHCFLHGRHLPEDISARLRQHSYRIISMSRAGYGQSSENTMSERPVLDRSASDYAQLVKRLELGRCDLLAHATGFSFAYRFATSYPEISRRLVGLDAVPPANDPQSINALKGLFRSTTLAMTKAPDTFSLMTRFVFRRLFTFDDPNKSFRRHILYPEVPIEEIESAAGLKAATQNVKDIMVNQLNTCLAESQIFKSDWSKVAESTNTKPDVHLLYTKNNPFVTRAGTIRFAESISSRSSELGETFPFLTPYIERIISNFSKGLPDGD